MTTQKDTMPDVISFLLGEGTLDGWGYGERPANTAAFWWRKALREAWNTRADIIKAKDDEIADLKGAIAAAQAMFRGALEANTKLKAERDFLAQELIHIAIAYVGCGYEDLSAVKLARKIVKGEKC